MRSFDRRSVLAAGASGLAGLAGCAESVGIRGEDGSNGTPGGSGLTLQTVDAAGSAGKPIAVQPTGQVVLLDFFATWCAPCKPQMAELRSVREEFPDVHMLSITWENDEKAVKGFWREYQGTWPVAMDTKVTTGQKYDVDGLPTMVIIDPDGTEVWRHKGLATADTVSAKLEAARK